MRRWWKWLVAVPVAIALTVYVATFVYVHVAEGDKSRRDNQFNGRIMDVSQYPTSTFTLTQPIELGTLPADGQQITTKATGRLTLRGTTKTVTVDLQARRNGANIEVASTIPITFADWRIPNPSFGPAETEDHGEIELLLVFAKAAA